MPLRAHGPQPCASANSATSARTRHYSQEAPDCQHVLQYRVIIPDTKGAIMALAFTIVIALVLVVLGLVGYIRDLRRGLLALIGTLAGASLVSFWAAQWGQALAGRVGGDPQRLIFIVS